MKIYENIQWITIILLSFLTYKIDIKFSVVLLFWAINIVACCNIKEININSNSSLSLVIRRVLYLSSNMLCLLFLYKDIYINVGNVRIQSILLSIIIGVIFVSLNLTTWRIILSTDFIKELKKDLKVDYITNITSLILSPIIEEVIFRLVIFKYFLDTIGLGLTITLSCYMFLISHIGTKWGCEYSLRDIVIQIVFSASQCLLFYITGSIIPCIIVHLIYNLPNVLLSLRSYNIFYKNNN